MPSLKGLACVSLLALVIAAPSAFAQSTDNNAPPPRTPATGSGNPAVTPGDQQPGQTKQRPRRSRKASTPQGQSNTSPTDQR
jgi:hypothetical protein